MEEGKHYVVKAGKLLEEGISKAEHDAKFPVLIGNGGTGATDAEAARNNLGAAKNWGLLWANSNPTESFAGQTITIPNIFVEFNCFQIICKNLTNGEKSSYIIALDTVNETSVYRIQGLSFSVDFSSVDILTRSVGIAFTASQDIVSAYDLFFTWTDAYKINTVNGNITANITNVLVPLGIYGTVI